MFAALRELTIPPDSPKRPIGFVTPEDKPKGATVAGEDGVARIRLTAVMGLQVAFLFYELRGRAGSVPSSNERRRSLNHGCVVQSEALFWLALLGERLQPVFPYSPHLSASSEYSQWNQ